MLTISGSICCTLCLSKLTSVLLATYFLCLSFSAIRLSCSATIDVNFSTYGSSPFNSMYSLWSLGTLRMNYIFLRSSHVFFDRSRDLKATCSSTRSSMLDISLNFRNLKTIQQTKIALLFVCLFNHISSLCLDLF